MNILVTGGSGFLGGYVLPLLVAEGHEVSALARSATAAERVAAQGARPVLGDLDDPESIDAGFCDSGAEVLVNLASLGFGHAPAILAAAEEAGMGRAVFVSTTAIYTTLESRSRATRVAAEQTISASPIAWTILRPTMIYGGPGDRNMARLLRLVRKMPVVPLPGGGRALQQPVHVEDLAGAVVAVLGAPTTEGQAYDIAGPEPLTMREVVSAAALAVGRQPRMVSVPLRPLIALARLYELISRDPRLRAEQLERLDEDKTFNIGPASSAFGYAPRPFSIGIRQATRVASEPRTSFG
jgi:uncharacterized protein YbjT (DUF2867 family)